MKVKTFHTVISSASGSWATVGDLGSLDRDINAFLEASPDIKVVDIKLTSLAAAATTSTDFAVVALLLYEPPA